MNKKGERSLLFGISLFLMLITIGFVVFFGVVIAAELDMAITGSNATLSDIVKLKTNPGAHSGKDVYDLEQSPAPPSDYVQLYSEITDGSAYDLAIDVWNQTTLGLPRLINLTFHAAPAYTGTVNFSWDLLTGTDFYANFTYFGNDSSYGTSYANVDMRSDVYYVNSSLLVEDYVYAQIFVWDYNIPPSNITPTLNSTDGSNKTLQDLNCYATLDDAQSPADKINVTIRWYKNGALNLTVNYNNNYPDGYAFNAILDDGNTTKTENWTCSLRQYDGEYYSDWKNSSNVTILNTAPTIDSIDEPDNHNLTTNRTPLFDWTASDDDEDTLTHYINLSCYYSGSYVSSQSGIYTNSNSQYVPPNYLKCLQDNNQNYNWSVRVSDGEVNTSWSSERNISIDSSVTISLSVSSANFGNISIGQSNDTTNDNPPPILIDNAGNCQVNLSINFTDSLWDSFPNPTDYFNFSVRSEGGEECYYSTNVSTATNAYTAEATSPFITRLNFSAGYQAACDNASVDIYVYAAEGEYAGDKSSTISFISSFGEPRIL